MNSEKVLNIASFSKVLKNVYHKINMILERYMDMTEYQCKIIALWVIAANFKDCFNTMPLLFINAPRASGKSRLLHILENLIPHSMLTISLTEANLFRVPAKLGIRVLLIDEAENISSKEHGNLKDLLNACYKNGTVVVRQKRNPKTNNYETEIFNPYMAVALANIWGLESVLESRAITIVLDRSTNVEITRKPELFGEDEDFKSVRESLMSLSDNVGGVGNVGFSWGRYIYVNVCKLLMDLDIYINNNNINTNTTNITNTFYNSSKENNFLNLKTDTLADTSDTIFKIYKKLKECELTGRDFELWLPLLIIAGLIDEETLNEAIDIAEAYTAKKHEVQILEDRDTTFLLFLGELIKDIGDNFISLAELRRVFREQEDIPKHENWPSVEWIGRALNRMNIIIERRRLARGREVRLNKNAIEEKIKKLEIKR